MKRLNPSICHAHHPSDYALEEYLFGRHTEHDLENVETHVLACESCVSKLELLETDIAALKLALCDLSNHSSNAQPYRSIGNWVSVPPLAWATLAVLLALCVSLPKIAQHGTPITEVTLHAYRGSEIAVVPVHHSALLRMDALDLPAETVSVQLVDIYGKELWAGHSSVKDDQAEVILPAQPNTGTYFLRFYGPLTSSTDTSLLREFVFEVD
jgi:hypothetical protein